MSHLITYESWRFPSRRIKGGNIHLAASLLSSSLEVNTFAATVECDDPAILNFKRNSKLYYYSASGQGTVWRVQNIERIAPRLYNLSATSTLGLLTEGKHYGGIYSAETAEEVIRDICGAVPVVIKSNLRKIKLYGWLPIAAPRDNLSQVLFAIGAALKSDLDGVLRIEPLWNGISGTVGANRMYVESKAIYTASVTSVLVTEHQYIENDEDRNLYEGDAKYGSVITFSEPAHSLIADGFQIIDSGANWAKLSAGTGTLRGKTYTHNTRENILSVSSAEAEIVKSVTDSTLVSFYNSDFVARRLKEYYQCRETIEAPVIYRGELPGALLDTFHPFDYTSVSACLQSADITLSNTLKAQEKSLIGFVPTQGDQIGYYDSREVILESGEWIVPDGVRMMRVVLIGGGDGGEGGAPGKSPPSRFEGGAGGVAGKRGNGGCIYQFSREVEPGEVYVFNIGQGGDGGVVTNESSTTPQMGRYTTMLKKGASALDTYVSLAGAPSETGFVDSMTGEVYALPGADGVSGGAGGRMGSSGNYTGESGEPAKVESDPGIPYLGGPGADGGKDVYGREGFGAGGGGGALGQAGTGGGISNANIISPGGNGGTPIAVKDASVRGCGGNGGHGGGGAGSAGQFNDNPGTWIGAPGKPGQGVPGGKGMAGIAIIYYQRPQSMMSCQFRTRDGKSLLDRLNRRIIV